jgi:hypothetical protein
MAKLTVSPEQLKMKIMFVYRAVDDEALLAKEEAEHTQVNFIRCIGIGLSEIAGTVFTKWNLGVSVSTS